MELSRRQMQEAINARAAEHAEKMKEASLYHSAHSPAYTNLCNILYTCTFFISYSNANVPRAGVVMFSLNRTLVSSDSWRNGKWFQKVEQLYFDVNARLHSLIQITVEDPAVKIKFMIKITKCRWLLTSSL
jgi:hypothetical protein